jgi:hypothetical protein
VLKSTLAAFQRAPRGVSQGVGEEEMKWRRRCKAVGTGKRGGNGSLRFKVGHWTTGAVVESDTNGTRTRIQSPRWT